MQITYSNCPKIWNTKVSDKMAHANSADPNQTAPEHSDLGLTLFAIPLSTLAKFIQKSME